MLERLAVALLAVALIGPGWTVYGETAPLTDEAVVRLFVTGTSESDLIRRIETSEVDFDLAQEMLDELKIAGLPESVIQAMISRQAAMEPPIESAEPPPVSGAPRLLVRLNPGWPTDSGKAPATIQALNDVDPRLAERLGLRRSDLPITDLSIALFCRTADHVPDHWRSASPLGRDFINAARHRMLVYISGAETKPAGKLRDMLSKLGKVPGERDSMPDLEVLILDVPERLAVEIEPGVAHDLTLGIAIRVGGRAYLTVADHLDGFVLDGTGDTTIRAVLRGGKNNPLKARVEFVE